MFEAFQQAAVSLGCNTDDLDSLLVQSSSSLVPITVSAEATTQDDTSHSHVFRTAAAFAELVMLELALSMELFAVVSLLVCSLLVSALFYGILHLSFPKSVSNEASNQDHSDEDYRLQKQSSNISLDVSLLCISSVQPLEVSVDDAQSLDTPSPLTMLMQIDELQLNNRNDKIGAKQHDAGQTINSTKAFVVQVDEADVDIEESFGSGFLENVSLHLPVDEFQDPESAAYTLKEELENSIEYAAVEADDSKITDCLLDDLNQESSIMKSETSSLNLLGHLSLVKRASSC